MSPALLTVSALSTSVTAAAAEPCATEGRPLEAVVQCLDEQVARQERELSDLRAQLAAHVGRVEGHDADARISRALFVSPFASSVRVTCGDVEATGTLSVRLRDFPAGECSVRVDYLGQPLVASVEMNRARQVRCDADSERLTCR